MLFWNFRDTMEPVFLHFLERFVTSEKKQVCIMTLFKNIWNFRDNFENKVAKACLLTLFERYLKLQ